MEAEVEAVDDADEFVRDWWDYSHGNAGAHLSTLLNKSIFKIGVSFKKFHTTFLKIKSRLKTKHNRKYPIDGDFLLFWIFVPILMTFTQKRSAELGYSVLK